MAEKKSIVNMFWAYGKLSKLEKIAISSFIYHKYEVHLWTYDNIPNVPKGAFLKDASSILPEARVFLNRQGSYASFADLFRYTLLNAHGGLYSDTDVIALTDCDNLESIPFLVTERNENSDSIKINNNIIFNPVPASGNIIDLAYAVSDRYPPEKIYWDQIGPQLLTSLVLLQQDHEFKIQAPEFANAINYWDCPMHLLLPNVQVPDVPFLHCYNEMWKRRGVDKEAQYPPNSLMSMFETRYLI